MTTALSGWMSTITGCVSIFLLGSLCIALAGTKMASLADRLADRTGIGEAITGTVFLGLTTALPGIVATITTASEGLAGLTISNALGGIAIQTVFLAVADLFHKKVNLEHASASLVNMIQTAFLIFLLVLICAGFLGPIFMFGHMNIFSFFLFFSAAAAIYMANYSKSLPMWKPQHTRETIIDRPLKKAKSENLLHLFLKFSLASIVVLISGYAVAQTATQLVVLTGISQTIVGGVFLAVATSFPELFTTIAAVRMGALTLAVGDIVGGNFFDSLFIAIGDVFYTEGSVFQGNGVSVREHFLGLLCMLLNVTLLIGLLVRQKKGPGNIGIESFLMIVFYLGGMALVYFAM